MKSDTALLITNIPTPYRVPLFNELSRQLREKGLRLKVVFGALGYPRRKWQIDLNAAQFDYAVLHSRKIKYRNPESLSFTYSRLFKTISQDKPFVVIGNGFSLATTKLWLRSFLTKTPYIIWSAAIEDANRSALRRALRKALTKRAAGFVAAGTLAKKYLLSLGCQPEDVEIGINTVDTSFYMDKGKEDKSAARENRHLLYVGALNPRKNVLRLLNVVRLLAEQRRNFVLDVVGDGEEQENLERYVTENHLTELVRFHGFHQKEKIKDFYRAADLFLFQTDFDIWGLVLVEAMAAGLPCISSIRAGATHDLIKDGTTGFALDFAEAEKATEKINWILDHPELSKEMGRIAQEFIAKDASLETSARGFVKAVCRVNEAKER